MKEIKNNTYQIEKDKELYEIGLKIINKPLPTSYLDINSSFLETANILNEIIEKRNKQIELVEDKYNEKTGNILMSDGVLLFTCVLDKDTEDLIEALIKRENDISNVNKCNSLCIEIYNRK